MSPRAPDATTTLQPPASRWRSVVARFALVAALLAVALAAYWTGLAQTLSPELLSREQDQLRAAAAASPVLSLGLFVLAYAVLTGACLPVALVLSLLGGAVFGVWSGAPAVLLGGTGGAILTYAAARSAFAPLLVRLAERDVRLQLLIAGFGRSAFRYILTLRLFPMAPFALVNVASGLAAVPLRPYALATLAGGVPTALIYTGLGAGLGSSLGSEQSLVAALRSPQIVLPLIGLTLLSLAPALIKRARRS
ncbi:VTT domain-containing protein [Phenylobacterium sp. LjRoot219]|uniref:TVP38/TMEM64 family protein n=1 Tax=Phenylobacterium sp. LjRoot219 TaxID=3342283 RepID=UPI003ECC6F30